MKLFGKNPALERLKSNPQTIRKIFIQEQHPDASYIRQKAKKWNIPVFSIPKNKILKLAPHQNTQGILVEVEDFAYTLYDELIEEAKKKKRTLIFLDGLNDPQNLGGIIRSLGCLGSFAVVLPVHGSVEITEAVLRVASGGDNYVQVAKVQNLVQALGVAKKEGFWIAGTVVQGGKDLFDIELPFPLALVIGSEQKGIRDVIKKQLDLELTIPMGPERMSLNVAHATTILAYEVTKQKNKNHNKRISQNPAAQSISGD